MKRNTVRNCRMPSRKSLDDCVRKCGWVGLLYFPPGCANVNVASKYTLGNIQNTFFFLTRFAFLYIIGSHRTIPSILRSVKKMHASLDSSRRTGSQTWRKCTVAQLLSAHATTYRYCGWALPLSILGTWKLFRPYRNSSSSGGNVHSRLHGLLIPPSSRSHVL